MSADRRLINFVFMDLAFVLGGYFARPKTRRNWKTKRINYFLDRGLFPRSEGRNWLFSRANLDFPVQPYPRPCPIILGRGFRNTQDFGGLGNGHADEIPQLDQLGLGLVVGGE